MRKLIGLVLLNYYLIQLVVYEDGPFDVFAKFRYGMGINSPVKDIDNNVAYYESNGTPTAKALSCHICSGFWTGLLISLFFADSIEDFFTIVGGGIFMQEIINRD